MNVRIAENQTKSHSGYTCMRTMMMMITQYSFRLIQSNNMHITISTINQFHFTQNSKRYGFHSVIVTMIIFSPFSIFLFDERWVMSSMFGCFDSAWVDINGKFIRLIFYEWLIKNVFVLRMFMLDVQFWRHIYYTKF